MDAVRIRCGKCVDDVTSDRQDILRQARLWSWITGKVVTIEWHDEDPEDVFWQ